MIPLVVIARPAEQAVAISIPNSRLWQQARKRESALLRIFLDSRLRACCQSPLYRIKIATATLGGLAMTAGTRFQQGILVAEKK